MKILQIIAWMTSLIGLILKLALLPASHLFLALGIALLFIHSVVYLIKFGKENLSTAFLNLAFSFWTLYLFFRIYYLYCGPLIFGLNLLFIIPTCLTITSFVFHFQFSAKFKTPQILLIIYFIFSIWLSNIHSDKVFYFFNLNTVTRNENRNENYWDWDKYSWFLYISNKQDEAILANLKAQQIIEEKIKKTNDRELLRELKYIKKHNQLILNKNWIDFQ